jgi:hypothetical protein
MKQRGNIEKRVQEALNSLDNIQRAASPPFFYTRFKAGIERKRNEWAGIAGFISRPVFALAMICVVLFVNSWILYKNDDEIIKTSGNLQTVTNDFPDEYDLTVSTLYNYETP